MKWADLFGIDPDFDKEPEHCHEYECVGYGGAGWFLYRCECGAEEIDA